MTKADTPIRLGHALERARGSSPDFDLPVSLATQASAFVGKRGSGKTYAAGRSVEELLREGVQVVVLDAVGNWFGLRLKRDGVTPSDFDIPILGGHRGDVALLPDAGAVVARSLVETGSSAVLDVSLFRKEGRKQFATALAEELLHLKKTTARKTRLCLVLEEAQLYIPQNTGKGAEGLARMLGAFEDLVKLGRNYGIGVIMLSQRPQAVNKDVLNQAELLLAFQQSGAHERDAIKAWVSERDAGETDIVEALTSLAVGQAFAWSPSWLRFFGKVKIREKRTFDASATPTEDDIQAGTLKPLDLGALSAAMAEVEVKAAENDPRKLKVKIAEYEAALAEIGLRRDGDDWDRAGLEAEVKVARDQVRELAEERRRLLADAEEFKRAHAANAETIERLKRAIDEGVSAIRTAAGDMTADVQIADAIAEEQRTPATSKAFRQAGTVTTSGEVVEMVPRQRQAPAPTRVDTVSGRLVPTNGNGLKSVERKLLTALAQSQGTPRKRDAWLILANLKPSGDVSTAVARFTKEGWTETVDVGTVITAAGLKALGTFDRLPTGADLRAHLLATLPAAQAKILKAHFDVFPKAVGRAWVLERAGLKPSGDVSTAYGKFRKLGWIEDLHGGTVASKVFYGR